MKFSFFNSGKFWKRFALFAFALPVILIGSLILIIYLQQDKLVQGEIDALNETHNGLIEIGDTHLAPFANFPYISIKVDDFKVYESKEEDASVILDVADIYVGFNMWDIVAAKYDVQKLLVEDGFFNVIEHKDGTTNIGNALASSNQTAEQEEPLDIYLKNIELKNLDIHELFEADSLDIETFIYWAKSGIKTGNDQIAAHIDTEFELNIIEGRDTSFIKKKHFEFHTDIMFNELSGLLEIAPSGIKMENGDFMFHGSIETKQDMTLDLHVNGSKPNFDMLIAFAPENLIQLLEQYENAGDFYFLADVVGPAANGQMPFIDVQFGADEAFMENVDVGKRVDKLGFKGHFTNGEKKSLETMEFSIVDFTSKLEKGSFIASVFVQNFIEPEVDFELHTDFNLDFLAQFFNLSVIENPSGNVKLDMHFHDIIDLEHPEKALNELNQAYYSELRIQNLHVESPDLPAPIDDLDMHLAMTGKRGVLDTFNLSMGATDLSLKGSVSDLPAIVHHTNIPVEAELEINSKMLDISELSGFSAGDSTGIDEQIEDLSLRMKVKSSARAFTESKYLPEGEFFIEKLHAQLKHYPHELHDFHADIIVDDKDLEIIDFSGEIDNSDFHVSGDVRNYYGFWIEDSLKKDVNLDVPIEAEMRVSSDVFDIAELTGFTLGDSSGIDEQIEDFIMLLKFNSSARAFAEYEYLPEGEFFIEGLHAQLKNYPHELHDFHADVLIDDQDLRIVDFSGFIDDSDFHFNGDIHDYTFWMKGSLEGDVKLDISLKSDLLKLEDVFSYQGQNYVPEDYRHEEFDKLALHVNTAMHYKASELHSIDIDLDQFDAKMHVHPMRFEDFLGRFHYEDEHLVIENMHGKMGRTVFDINMNYYLGKDEAIKLRDNHFGLKANYIDFDQLFAFNLESPKKISNTGVQLSREDVESHSSVFNIYELPFTDMTFDIDVNHFIYHQIDLQNIHGRFRTTHDHYIHVDTMSLNVADGAMAMSGYFNGSNPDKIYLKPNLKLKEVDLDKMMFKFENFGQDVLVSDNIHGKISADITGNIRIYPDMVPDVDQSEIHMDVELLNGRLENYEPVLMLSDYMGDKNLSSIRFDTLQNHMDITNGVITIPGMTIESTLGHYELAGEQSISGKLDYYIRIPWEVIRQGAMYKLFGKKKTENSENIAEFDDEIIEKDATRKSRYLNLRIKGTLDDYNIKLGKKRKEKK
ncbi:hypothetical protein CEQ90_04635 [Lewinellaceae bacterium SD302]|nr:hypothetical protein CEQ90_04635 [Lewinellaceae bacterium SD302]